jgi:ADP-heptose:LPS heptosyltransferase
MFDGARLRVGLLYSRVHFRKAGEPVIRFTESVSQAKRALVVLPEATKDITSVQWVVRNLAERFSDGTVTVMARSEQAAWLKVENGNVQVLPYSEDDVNTWFIPRRELLGKMKRSTFDVALDLNVSFTLMSAFLCRESKAPLRVSFAKSFADEFFNFQINTRSTNSLAVAYRNLMRCLEMF